MCVCVCVCLYGVRINPADVEQKKMEWKKLSALMETYDNMFWSDPIFILGVGPSYYCYYYFDAVPF